MSVKKTISVVAAFAFVLTAQSVMSGYNPLEEVVGTASYYCKSFDGNTTASGEIYSNEELTAASNVFKLNTWVKVTNLNNLKSVVVKINDRMHPRMLKKGRVIDLSHSAAREIAMLEKGIIKVRVQVLPTDEHHED